MILNPAIIALNTGSVLISTFAVYASVIGIEIIRSWDIHSGSEQQLGLERKTYLVSTIVAYLLAFELFSLFLFVYSADHIHSLFVGAMCAVGSLNANDFGYPALIVKTANFVLCGLWIILNYTDSKGFDYPLIRFKYKFLLLITAMLILETILQANYFLDMKANIITSCCGTLFSEDARSVVGEIAALPPYATQVVFYLSVVLVFRGGIHFYVTGGAARIFSSLSTWLLFLSLLSVISFISVYFYEQPTHHCPFCLLQKEYHYLGYPLYLFLFAASILGASVGLIDRFRTVESLQRIIPSLQRRLCIASLINYGIFTFIVTYPILFSEFRMGG